MNLYTRKQLADHVANFIQDTSTKRRDLILDALDKGYLKARRKFNWPQLLRWSDAIVTATAGGAFIYLPKDVDVLLKLVDATSPLTLQEIELGAMPDLAGGFTNINGIVVTYELAGVFGSNAALPNDQPLDVVSDGTDTRLGSVAGVLDNEPKRFNFTLTGTAAVTLGNFDEVTDFTLETSNANRVVSMRNFSTATVLATIGPGEQFARYKRYRLTRLPGQATTIRAVYKALPPAVLNEGHVYDLPIEDYLIEYAIAKAYEQRREDDLARNHFSEALDALEDAISDIKTRPGLIQRAVPVTPFTRRRSVDSI